MAEKLLDSIRRKVKGLKEKPERAAKKAPAQKTASGSPPAAAKAASPEGPADAATAPGAKPGKAKPQPWYRHRQRW